MQFSEDQIQRYSRHILLSDVGGTGQMRLLRCGARLAGSGATVETAAAYLAASGSAICAEGLVAPGDEGFLFSREDVGRSRAEAIDFALRDLNLDAAAPRGTGRLAALPAVFSGPGPWVGIGGSKGRGGILYRSERGCERCFERNALELESPPGDGASVLLGAVAALVFQRLCLNISADLGGLWVDGAGQIRPIELRQCPRCSEIA